MTSEQIRVRREGAVLVLTIDRPEKKNALTGAMYQALTTALAGADEDAAVHVVLIEGAGGAFSAGNDMADFASGGEGIQWAGRFLLRLAEQQKPIVAAVDGAAVGIGTTLLLHADFVVASTRARFKMPFVDLALVPEGGSSVLLPSVVGMARASEWLLFAEPFDAEAARAAGLINAVVAPEELGAFALARAQTLAQKPPGALVAAKKLLREPSRAAVKDAILREGEVFIERMASPEAAQAFAAFMARKRG